MGRASKKATKAPTKPAGRSKPGSANETQPPKTTKASSKRHATPDADEESDPIEQDDFGARERLQRCEENINSIRQRTEAAKRLLDIYGGEKISPEWIGPDGQLLPFEKILEMQIRAWSSPAYNYYDKPTIAKAGNEISYLFKCKQCGRDLKKRWNSSATSNLLNHAKLCNPGATELNTDGPEGASVAYSIERFRLGAAEWIASEARPLAIIESPKLAELFRMCNPRVELPSRKIVSRDIVDFYQISKHSVAIFLQNLPGNISLSIDGWTSPKATGYVAVLAHFVWEGKMEKVILDFFRTSASHTGKELANEVRRIGEEYNICHKVIAMVGDGVPVNDVMCDEMQPYFPKLEGRNSRVICHAHSTQNISKTFLSVFMNNKNITALGNPLEIDEEGIYEETDEDGEAEPEDLEAIAAQEAEINSVIDAVRAELEDEAEPELIITPRMIETAREIVPKLAGLATKLRYSTAVKSEFAGILQRYPAGTPTAIPRPCPTRWNSVCATIGAAANLEKPLRQLFALRGLGLEKFALSDEQWKMIIDMRYMLRAFEWVIKRASKTNYPMIHEVIPLIDFLQVCLDTQRANSRICAIVRFACITAQRMLNKCYAKTDNTWILRTAIILHPSMKMAYFEEQRWPDEWSKEAATLCRKIWKKYYAPAPAEGDLQRSHPAAKRSRKVFLINDDEDVNDFIQECASASSITSRLMRLNLSDALEDELESYLDEPPVEDLGRSTLLQWWKSKASTHPNLAKMAIDVLSVPSSSVDTERAFKQGRNTISYKRHQLADRTIQALLIFGDWSKSEVPGIVPRQLLERLLEDRPSRKANRITVDSAIDAIKLGIVAELLSVAQADVSGNTVDADEAEGGEEILFDEPADGGEH